MFLIESFIKKVNTHSTLESVVRVLKYLETNEATYLAILFGEYFFDKFSYSPMFLNQLAIAYYKEKMYSQSWKLYESILSRRTLSEYMANEYWKKAYLNINYIRSEKINYPGKKIQTILSKKSPVGTITFSITTCKRYDLFVKTMNSFISCCKDINLIDRWICVDDNSSTEDREQMKAKYPFFEFFFKGLYDKGHPRSMNMIIGEVNTPFLFHMEDDWQFFHSDFFLTDCIEVLNSDQTLGQCLINKNYAEVESDLRILGGIYKQTETGKRYYVHEYEENYESFRNLHGDGPSCAYWPHYSLRPGMNVSEKLKQVGKYREDVAHFEMEYAYRYVSMGFKTAFFDIISCCHIGRLTSQRFDNNTSNAYILNGEEQFGDKNISLFQCKVINLKSRRDRWDTFVELNDAKLQSSYERFDAVNGYTLERTRALEQLFNDNDYNFRKGMIGCALSHIYLWLECIQSKQPFVIIEDDIVLKENYTEQIQRIFSNDIYGADILFLGHHQKNVFPAEEQFKRCTSFTESLHYSLGGTGGYIITPNGSEKMIKFVQANLMVHGIDTMMQKACDDEDIQIIYLSDCLFTTECYHIGNTYNRIDTDIQRNFYNFYRHIDDRLVEEIEFLASFGLNIYSEYSNSWFYFNENIDLVVYICKKKKPGYYTYKLDFLYVNIPNEVVIEIPCLRNFGLWDNSKQMYTLDNIVKN